MPPGELTVDMGISDIQIPKEIKEILDGQLWFAMYPDKLSKYVVDMFTRYIWNPDNKPFLLTLSTEVKEALAGNLDPKGLIYKPKKWRRVNVSWYDEDCGTALIRVMSAAGFSSNSTGIFPALLIPDFLGDDIPGYSVEIWPVFHPKPEPWNNMDYFRYGRLPHPSLPTLGGYEKGVTNMLSAFNRGTFIPSRIVVEDSVIRYYAPADIVENCGWGIEDSATKNIMNFEELTPTRF